jgi:hypothetical protein
LRLRSLQKRKKPGTFRRAQFTILFVGGALLGEIPLASVNGARDIRADALLFFLWLRHDRRSHNVFR